MRRTVFATAYGKGGWTVEIVKAHLNDHRSGSRYGFAVEGGTVKCLLCGAELEISLMLELVRSGLPAIVGCYCGNRDLLRSNTTVRSAADLDDEDEWAVKILEYEEERR